MSVFVSRLIATLFENMHAGSTVVARMVNQTPLLLSEIQLIEFTAEVTQNPQMRCLTSQYENQLTCVEFVNLTEFGFPLAIVAAH